MRRSVSVEHKELTGRELGVVAMLDVEEHRNHSRRGRMADPERELAYRGGQEGVAQLVCEACGEAIDPDAGTPNYCGRCYQTSALEAEAIARQQSNRAEALASERDELAAKVDELTKLLQSRECQIKKLSGRVESLERDWRNVTSENQQLRQTLENTELRLSSSELERRLVTSQFEAGALQDVEAAVDALRREMRGKEQKWLERVVTLEKAMGERRQWTWRSLFQSWLRPQRETTHPS